MKFPIVKRAMDVGVAAAGLVVAGPVIGILAAAVRLDTPGPAFFGHDRVGRDGRRFRVWKLRTMREGAETQGLPVTAGGDDRVTPVGRFLRRWKLDELPQFVNVLVGEMSLVGPRPEVPQYVERFAPEYREILRVRPGLTDEATLQFRNEESVLRNAADPERVYLEQVLPAKLRLARQYVDSMSFARDLSILARTARAVLLGSSDDPTDKDPSCVS